MKSPKVSVIIPVYNAFDTIGAILEDCMSQTYPGLEVVAVDDGSKDQSLEKLREYALRDARITVITQENAGPSAARNTGIGAAKGEYIMFCDADDRVTLNAVERLVCKIKSEQSFDLVEAGIVVEYFDGQVKTREETLLPFDTNASNEVRILRSLLSGGLFHSLTSKIYRTAIIRDNNLALDVSIKNGEDLIFNLSYMQHVRRYGVIKEGLYQYRRLRGSDSITSAKNVANNIFLYRMKMFKALRGYVGYAHLSLLVLLWFRWAISSIKLSLTARIHHA